MTGVQSPLTGFLQHMEVAMWSRGVDPVAAQEILNILMFGHPGGASPLEAGGPANPLAIWRSPDLDEAATRILDLCAPAAPLTTRQDWERRVREAIGLVFGLGQAAGWKATDPAAQLDRAAELLDGKSAADTATAAYLRGRAAELRHHDKEREAPDGHHHRR